MPLTYGPIGWKAGVHGHHDHSSYHRFPETVICGACNYADVRAKQICGAPAWFSFAPYELRQFITATDNGPVVIDSDIVMQIYLNWSVSLARNSVVT